MSCGLVSMRAVNALASTQSHHVTKHKTHKVAIELL